jgi:hypothetical protein
MGMAQPTVTAGMLADVRKVVAAGWTTKAYARTPDGLAAHPATPEANQFCLVGAVRRAFGWTPTGNAVADFLYEAVPKPQSLHDFNDASTHEGVLQFLDQQIAKLEMT